MPCHSIKISILQRHRLIGRRESRPNIIRLNIRERNHRIRILDLLLRAAEAAGDGVVGRDAGDADRGVLDHLSILDVEVADLFRCSRGGVVTGGELCDRGELPGSVDGYVGPVVASHAVRVVATAVFITNTVVMRGSTTAE